MVDSSATRMSEPTYSIFARAFRIEAPFLNEWFEHHFALGFDLVHLCVAGQGADTAAERRFLVDHIAPEFLPRVHFLECPDHPGVADIYEQLDLGRVWDANERVLIIDIDEFLVLQRHATIREFCAAMGLENDALFIEWVNYAADGWGYDGFARQLRAAVPWVGVNGKSLVRSGAVEKLNVHRHDYRPGARRRNVALADACLVHLCSRGLADILCRVLYGSVKTNSDDIAALRQLILGPELPATLPRRLILLHAQLYVARHNAHSDPLASPPSPLKFGGDSQALARLVGRALGATTAEEEIARAGDARNIVEKYEVRFTNTPDEIRELGGFVAMCNRLKVAERELIQGEGQKRVRYTVTAVPAAGNRARKPRRGSFFRRLWRKA